MGSLSALPIGMNRRVFHPVKDINNPLMLVFAREKLHQVRPQTGGTTGGTNGLGKTHQLWAWIGGASHGSGVCRPSRVGAHGSFDDADDVTVTPDTSVNKVKQRKPI